MKISTLLFTLLTIFGLSFCTTSKKTLADNKTLTESVKGERVSGVSYTDDISPIIERHCTPCHFPDGGKVKFLDSYAAVSSHIDDILRRVQLPHHVEGFMPFQSKKEPLSDSLIVVLKFWKQEGMPK